MATNGMTIDDLNNLSSLTANDEVPVWDIEASDEPTQKITAQNLANSVKSLASLPNTTEMNAAIQQSTAKTQAIVINENQTTWSAIYAKLKEGLNNQSRVIALIVVYSTAATSVLTGGNLSSFFKGYVTLSGANSNLYDFWGGPLSNGYMYSWRITASDSAPTVSAFKEFRDSANSAKSAFLSWGTTLTATNFRHGLLLLANTAAYIVWFSSTTNINIRSLRTGSVSKDSSNGTITFGADSADGTNYTITRNAETITVTSASNTTISLIYN